MRSAPLLRRVLSVLAVAACCLAGPPGAPARAQEVTRGEIALQDQILELRNELDQLRQQVATGGTAAPPPSQAYVPPPGGTAPQGDIAAQLLDRVSRLEDSVRSLQGKVDEVQNQLQQQNADLTKQIGDLAFRVQTLEGNAGGAGAGAGAGPAAPPVPAPGPARLSPPEAVKGGSLQQGEAALARRDYPAAEAAARAAIAARSPKSYEAQFLLAQALAGQKDYQKAALAYDDAYNKQRKGAHAPEALLGLARSLAALGDKPAACATIDKLNLEFPDQRPELRASAGALGKRSGCR